VKNAVPTKFALIGVKVMVMLGLVILASVVNG
jgi:hypothetical protein